MGEKALVIGGTGPTGPFIVNGLRERGYDVTIFHRGTHEVPEIPDDVDHIHGDPHFVETIDEALAGRSYDLTVATYGRIRLLAAALAGRSGRFLAVGGVAVYRGFFQGAKQFPSGLTAPVPEDAPLVESEEENHFAALMVQTERAVLHHHPSATVFRYPYVYGPYQLVPREWSIVRRLLDGRPAIILPNGGLTLSTHGWAGNLAHAVLLAVDQPAAAAGKIYNVGDLEQLTIRQVVEVIAAALGREVEIVSVPSQVAGPARILSLGGRAHQLMDTSRIQADLGYRDVLGVREALAQTARWYVDNPPEPGGDIETRLADPFDYAVEDRLIEAARKSLELMLAVGVERPGRAPHPYAHPKTAGQERDHRGR
ncbi:MAG: NAD-dependent epimerase/dehydratase family protein [Acidimicrobiales bacterium]